MAVAILPEGMLIAQVGVMKFTVTFRHLFINDPAAIRSELMFRPLPTFDDSRFLIFQLKLHAAVSFLSLIKSKIFRRNFQSENGSFLDGRKDL